MKPDIDTKKDYYCISRLGQVKESRLGGRYAQVDLVQIDLVNMNTLRPYTTYIYENMENIWDWEPVMELELQSQTAILTNLKIKTKRGNPVLTRNDIPVINADGVKIEMTTSRDKIDKWLRDRDLL